MEITALGHAGLRVSGSATTGLIDPWLTTSGAFLGSWHQLPANAYLATTALLSPAWVAISHDHRDHLDVETLERIPAGTPVFVPEYASKRLVQLLLAHTHLTVVEVDAWIPVSLDGAGSWLTFIPEHSSMNHEAAVLLSIDGVSLLDCNDARLTAAQAQRAAQMVGGSIDVMMVQASHASSHPICYEYSPEVMQAISARKRREKLVAVQDLARAVAPEVLIPFAGPPCFLDPKLAHLNRWLSPPGIFPDQDQASKWLAERLPGQLVRTLLPGDQFFPRERLTIEDPRWEDFSFQRLRTYLWDYAHARALDLSRVHTEYLYPDDSLGERFAAHFAHLGELSAPFLRQNDVTVRFDVEGPGGGRWDVHLGPEQVRVDLQGRAEAVQYRFRLRSRWLAPVVDGRLGWDDLLLSFRFTAWRDPGFHNDSFVGVLKHADRASLQAAEYEAQRDVGARIQVHGPRSDDEVSQERPHGSEDLAESGITVGGRCSTLATAGPTLTTSGIR